MSSKKSSKGVDRISELPNCLLCRILSLLETKSSVRTCILSKRWKSLWTNVPCLYFHRLPSPTKKLKKKGAFEKLVTMSLLLHKCQSLNKFRLVCLEDGDRFTNVPAWLTTAISRDVRELDIHLISSSNGISRFITLPSAIFTCKSLEILKLEGDLFVGELPSLVSLPSLESLHLKGVEFGSDNSVRKRIGGCPVLKYLCIERNKYDNVVVFTVSSLTLTHLEIKANGFAADKLEINAPSLEYLRLCDFMSKDFSFHNLKFLSELHLFDLDVNLVSSSKNSSSKSWVSKLVQALGHNELKILSIGNMDDLGGLINSDKILNLTKLIITSSTWEWEKFLKLLNRTYRLEVLELKTLYEGFDETWESHVPRCISSSLRKISICTQKYVYYNDLMLGMINHFLKHGENLGRIEIRCAYVHSDVLKKLLAFSRKSNTCEIHVLEGYY